MKADVLGEGHDNVHKSPCLFINEGSGESYYIVHYSVQAPHLE